MNSKCPLCHGSSVQLFYSQQNVNWKLYFREAARLEFFKCSTCELIFKDRGVTLPLESQRPRYLEHQNDVTEGYENFLMKLWGPLSESIAKGQHGLDFGCGPSRALQGAVAKKGVTCDYYDPIFWPNESLLKKEFDFVFCSEVVEHFLDLFENWQLLRNLLKDRATLGVMTSFYPNDFASWYYHRDPTHVSFYSSQTFSWITENFGFQLRTCKENVVLMVANQRK